MRGRVSLVAHGSRGLKTIQEEVAECRLLRDSRHGKHAFRQLGYKKWLVED